MKTLYEGWIFDDLYIANPFCVLFTELPPGLHVGEKLEYRVGFDGYFFKRYRYKDGQGTVRDCPLFIGRTLAVQPAPNSDRIDLVLRQCVSAGFSWSDGGDRLARRLAELVVSPE